MTKETQTDSTIDEFVLSTQNLISSKYLLIDRRISELLRAIASSEKIYNLIAECMVNFDFIEEWRNAVKENKLVLPADEAKKISFIFCMLNNVDDKNLDLTKVLDHYFSYDENHTPYELFCRSIVLEFRNDILKKLGFKVDGGEEQSAETSESSPQSEESDEQKLGRLLRKLNDFLHTSKRAKILISKEDLSAVISTFEFALKNGQYEYFYALSITLKYGFKKCREVFKLVSEIDNISTELIKRS